MIPAPFDYVLPETLDEALQALLLSETKLLAGGQSLLPILKLRLAAPGRLVDLGKIPELARIEVRRDGIVLGAMATHASIEDSSELAKVSPLLPEVAAAIGDRQVRNRGTIGGSLAHADPAADWPAAILALDAALVAASPPGPRTIPARDFFKGLMSTALAPHEILLAVQIPRSGPGGAAYQKARQSASGFALAGVAVVLEYGGGGVCKKAAIGVTGVADRPYRATAAEQALAGKKLDDASIVAAAALASHGVLEPLSDMHASGEYRLHLVRVHCARALKRAAGLSR
ncbi:MAG: xanthine dehydrogenase family protein subunit M [Planctomycetes bacterium]|nr:xanthine dehydrogenase family protein subunit M [Planctomycetota bacterium]